MTIDDYSVRFGGIRRLYGDRAAHAIHHMHLCVVGVGGVGTWAAEALARSGVGRITLIDHDDISLTNCNRQLHTLTGTIGRSKVEVMAERIREINPFSDCRPIDDLITETNLERHLNTDFDGVIDAIDAVRFKAAMIAYCSRQKIPIVTTGGAGGQIDPTRVTVADLSRTENDPLAAKVRSRLRQEYGFSRNPKRRFGVECVYSTEQPVYPRADGTVSQQKPGVHGATLDCNFGYGSVSTVTAVFGFFAAARAINRAVRRRLEGGDEAQKD